MHKNTMQGGLTVKKTSIILLTYNNLDDTALCVESIRSNTPADSYELIVVDNHSTDGTPDWIQEQTDIRFIRNESNRGFPAGCNQGIQTAQEGNDILLLNNDTMVMPNWLQNLQRCLYSREDVGAVGPVTNCCSNDQQIQIDRSKESSLLSFARKFNRAKPNYERKIKLVGFCLLIRRTVVQKIGLLDERFYPGNYEDDDYSFRIQRAGYQLLLSKNTFIYHKGSASFGKDPKAYQTALEVNAKKFEGKWGFNATYSTFVRYDILSFMQPKQNSPLRVLEVGCACGATLLKIKEQFPNAEIYGIECNAASAAIASRFADIQSVDIEQVQLDYDTQTFDYILFADVLEHLRDPERALRNVRQYLKTGGAVLASIPNIMHYSVLSGLLNGNFTYQDAGILDRTHLRFFTLAEIIRLFAVCGYTLPVIQSKQLPRSSQSNEWVDRLVAVSGEEKRQQFETYQYLLKAQMGPQTSEKGAAFG